MTEKEYIALSNRVRISAALETLRGVLPGCDGVTDKHRMSLVMNTLHEAERKLFEVITVDTVDD